MASLQRSIRKRPTRWPCRRWETQRLWKTSSIDWTAHGINAYHSMRTAGESGSRGSPLSITDSDELVEFPAPLGPVQVDDKEGRQEEMGRGAVWITVTSNEGQQVCLVTAHLKSKLLTFPGGRFNPRNEAERARFAAYALYRRAAEAATLRVWATGVLDPKGKGLPVVLCGDLNDTVQAATTQMLLGPPGSELDTRGFKTPDKGDAQRLWNLAPLMPAGRNYSRINQGRPELIDHILVSELLVRKVDINSVGAVVVEPLPSITPVPTARLNEPSSDHAPVVATFLV